VQGALQLKEHLLTKQQLRGQQQQQQQIAATRGVGNKKKKARCRSILREQGQLLEMQ